MKKVMRIMLMSTIIFTLVGCKSHSENKKSISDNVLIENNEETLNVKITAKEDLTTGDGMPIKLNSKLTGEHNKDIKYHWILETSKEYEKFEGFVAEGKGALKEIINSGEEVELGLFADVSWVEGTVVEFKVKLQVEEKELSKIIATDEITIENSAGHYKIK